MSLDAKKHQLIQMIKSGFELLQQEFGYKQIQILKKLKTLELAISSSSLSNIMSDKAVGMDVLNKASKGMNLIVELELGFQYDASLQKFVSIPQAEDSKLVMITEFEETQVGPSKELHYYPEGRLSIQEKTDFLSDARTEIIELGVRLKTFTDYFYSRNESEFARPIKDLLKRNVNLKLYLIDPKSHEASLYFRDRARVNEDEASALVQIEEVIRKLRKIHVQFKQEQLPGQFEVFLYKHFPYNHFLVVDGSSRMAKMMVSHYLYGLSRANSPVVTFSKQTNYNLYMKYWGSLKALTKDAKKILLD